MTMGTVIPFGNKPWFRYTMGWMTPPNMVMLKSLRRPTDREKSIREQVWQDAGFPAERLTESVNKSHDLFEIYPLLCYPCKIIDNGGMVRSPENHGKEVCISQIYDLISESLHMLVQRHTVKDLFKPGNLWYSKRNKTIY